MPAVSASAFVAVIAIRSPCGPISIGTIWWQNVRPPLGGTWGRKNDDCVVPVEVDTTGFEYGSSSRLAVRFG